MLTQLVKKFLYVKQLEISLEGSKQPTIGSYPDSVESSSHIHNNFSKINFNIILPFNPKSCKDPFSGFPNKILHVLLISLITN